MLPWRPSIRITRGQKSDWISVHFKFISLVVIEPTNEKTTPISQPNMSSQSKAPIPPNSSTKPRVSRKVVVSARMSQQDINVLKADIESAARAVASVRETSRLLGSALSAHSSQFPESIDLTEKWAKIDAASVVSTLIFLHRSTRQRLITTCYKRAKLLRFI